MVGGWPLTSFSLGGGCLPFLLSVACVLVLVFVSLSLSLSLSVSLTVSLIY